jgi:hypothetical protein
MRGNLTMVETRGSQMKSLSLQQQSSRRVVGDKVINFGDALIKARLGAPKLHHARNHRRSGEQSGGDADRAMRRMVPAAWN